ncbi:HD domain-containing protein [Deltaproteobacteria bacterium]|nr:HD domain-containing protein [Deltaproteobacteria bacterium]
MKKRNLNIDDIKRFAMNSCSAVPGSHDWGHTLRVYNMCMHIGQVEKADMEILGIAAYLHDVGRPFQDRSKGSICHAEKGAEIAEGLLEGVLISEARMANIIHSIRSHRFRGNSLPESLEAKVLFDADKLDSIGAIGIGRAFQFAGENGARLHNPSVDPEDTESYTIEDTGYREFRLKLSKIKERMLTSEGRRIARDRHEFMEVFFDRFLREYKGS